MHFQQHDINCSDCSKTQFKINLNNWKSGKYTYCEDTVVILLSYPGKWFIFEEVLDLF